MTAAPSSWLTEDELEKASLLIAFLLNTADAPGQIDDMIDSLFTMARAALALQATQDAATDLLRVYVRNAFTATDMRLSLLGMSGNSKTMDQMPQQLQDSIAVIEDAYPKALAFLTDHPSVEAEALLKGEAGA